MYYINRAAGTRPQDGCNGYDPSCVSPIPFSTGFSTMPELTTEQWDKLIEQYTQIIVDGMDWKDMERFVFDTIQRDLGELESRQDLCDDIKYTFDQELLDELVDNVTTVTYGLKEGETLSFPVHKKSS